MFSSKQNLSTDKTENTIKSSAEEAVDTDFDPFIYQNVGDDKIDDLGTYLQWHRDHPYCSTPRAPRRGVESQVAAGSTFWCDENSEYAGKVYITFSPKKDSDIPEEFKSKPIGARYLNLV